MDNIGVDQNRFVDQTGRQRLFHGLNLVWKGEFESSGRRNYIGPWTDKDFAEIAKSGFNVIRLGLIWDAVEPKPGQYNTAYLDWIAQMLDLCAWHQIYVVLDMHQDLFSSNFGDGAPAWATLTDEPFKAHDPWSDAYVFSKAVQYSFDAFWTIQPASDGVSLQEHYIAMWAHIAERFAEHPALLGYDFFNEPNQGSGSSALFLLMAETMATLRSRDEGQVCTPESILQQFADPHRRLELLAWLDNADIYRQFISQVSGPVAAFDQQVLGPFYNRINHAVRTVSSKGISFRENSYFSNMGIPCLAEPIRRRGKREPMQAYAPHGYDLTVDSKAPGQASNQRAEVIFQAHRQTQSSMDVPVLVGEWGAFYESADVLDHAQYLTALFDRYQWSDTYWSWTPGWQNLPAARALLRPYPQSTAGSIEFYTYDRSGGHFQMRWLGNSDCIAETDIYLPRPPQSVQLVSSEHAGQALETNWRLQDQHLLIAPMAGHLELSVEF